MISYKRDVLERQSLSEVKSRGSPICERVRKKIVEYYSSTSNCKGFANLIIYSA